MITESMLDALREEMKARLSESRYRHTLGVEKQMRELAALLCPDRMTEAAAVALLHDCTKFIPMEEQIAYCEQNGIPVTDEERASPPIMHAKTGAHFARTHYSALVTDEMICAIEQHTTADENMSLLSRMLCLSDYIEEGRVYEDCRMLRAMFYRLLSEENALCAVNKTLLCALEMTVEELIRDGRHIAERTVRARNALLVETRKN